MSAHRDRDPSGDRREGGPPVPGVIRVLLAEDQALVRDGLRLLLELEGGFEVTAVANGREAVAAARRAPPDVAVIDVRMPVLDGIGCVRLLRREHPPLPIVMLTTYQDDGLVRECLEAGADAYLLKDMAPEDLANALRLVAAGDGLIPGDLARRLLAEPIPPATGPTAAPLPCPPADAGSGPLRGPTGSAPSHPAGALPAPRPAAGPAGPRPAAGAPAVARPAGRIPAAPPSPPGGPGSAAAAGGEPLTPRQQEVLALLARGLTNREIARRLYLSEGTVKNVVSEIYARLNVRDRVQAVLKARGWLGDGSQG